LYTPIYVLLLYRCGVCYHESGADGRPNTLSAGGRRVVVGDAAGCDVTVDVLSFTLAASRFSQNCFRFPMPLAQCHCRAQTSRLLRYTRAIYNIISYPNDVVQTAMAYHCLLRSINLFYAILKHREPSKQ